MSAPINPTVPEGLETAFDIALVPEPLQTEDPLDQGDAYLAALAGVHDLRDEALRAFRNASRNDIDLGDLERIFKAGNKTVAMGMLQGRRRITYGPDHALDADKRTMYWDTSESYLDMLVCVGGEVGLAPLLPSLDSHHNFSFQVNLSDSRRAFTAKKIKLGFNRTGCMMWIGCTGASEDSWLAFVPQEYVEEGAEAAAGGMDEEPPNPNPSKVLSSLTQVQQRQVRMFLAYCFEQIHYRGITVTDPYPDVTNDMEYRSATNIFDRQLNLNLQELKQLDRAIRHKYKHWIRNATPSYKSDDFFPSRVPICVTSRFGQNHKVGVNPAQERLTWQVDRDWARIRYVNVALATHISVNPVEEWEAKDIDRLEQTYPDGIFDSDDLASRNRLTHEQLEAMLEAEFGTILPRVYSNRGYVVETHQAYLGETPYGVLIKATGLQQAFAPLPTPTVVHPMQVDADEQPQEQVAPIDAPRTSAPPFFFYPQAGLRNVGHFQADGLISSCYPIVGRLNQRLRDQNLVVLDPHGNDSDDDMDGVDYTSRRMRVVEPIASQGYNAMMHHTRGRSAQHHDAQLGLVTAAISGQWATTPGGNSARAFGYLTQCQYEMPHASFNTKIQPDDLCRDLRLENVYCFNMMALAPGRRSGAVIVTDIIRPLLRIWDHASTRATVENHIQLFHPTAYPALYSWTTYPLTALLDHILAEALEVFEKDKFKHTLLVELCSVVERGLNYMHTGNAAVIASSVMSPLWIGKALVADGFPCFNSDIVVILNGKRLTISAPSWPMSVDSARPLSSSRATQLFRYDRRHFNVFYAHLAMGIVVAKPPPPFIKESNELRQRAFALMAYCVMLFIDDCKDLVSTEVSKALKRQRLLPHPQPAYAVLRSDALNRWKTVPEPLSYGKYQANTFASLLSCISENPNGQPPDGTEVADCLSYVALAKHMLAATQSTGSVGAPFWKHGSCLTALEIALVEIQHLLDVPKPDSEGIVAEILATTLRDLKVDFVPWNAPSRSTRGTTHVVSHLHWMSIDRTNPSGPLLHGASRDRRPASARMTQIQQVAVSRAINDKSSEWHVPLDVSQMGSLWDKTVLPLEWSWKNSSMSAMGGPATHEYMRETYRWAHDTYNKDNWKHHMALVWAILVTTVLPNLHVSEDAKERLRAETSVTRLNQAIRNLKWEPPQCTKKGMKERGPFITMVTTYFMALMDPLSPLLTNLGERGGFGDPWTKKHNPKYIHGLLVVRLGIADAKAASVGGVPKYNDNFEIRSDRQLRDLYDRIMGMLKTKEYGVYFAVCELFSTEMGEYAVKKGHGSKPVVHSSQS